jgi:hypothetical protein
MINTIANTATEIGFANWQSIQPKPFFGREYSFVFFVIIKQA